MNVIVPLITLPLIYLILLAAGILPWVLLRRKDIENQQTNSMSIWTELCVKGGKQK